MELRALASGLFYTMSMAIGGRRARDLQAAWILFLKYLGTVIFARGGPDGVVRWGEG
jgi:hypothetical protein